MKTLHLPLKTKWYEMIESGIKTEEYREIKPYWGKRLIDYKELKRDYNWILFRRVVLEIPEELLYPTKEELLKSLQYENNKI